ncbi:carbohydrate ABC transporter permease [Oceanobacillus sojae]|uniref:carbohydrate ABC transporter permease n=1 Tax=Oceanobacillus sojae TaxID=582851 RepID=UPI00098838A9|nr:carbohydrate ABC transporter permease [Oceanobacillus sojae]MCT1903080.1 carbohydrate ABC transporter permease [Oceanobacillus sojae]
MKENINSKQYSNSRQKEPKSAKIQTRIFKYSTLIGLGIFALIILYPLFWMLISSFKSYEEIYSDVWNLPGTWNFSNYTLAWEQGIQNYFINSLYVTGFAILITVTIGSMAAFTLSRYRNRWIDIALLFIIGGLMMNPQVALIPLFEILTFFNLIDTRWALILTYVAYRLPLTIILIRAFFLTVPKELSESALLDGCSEFGIYRRIYLPLSIPVVVTTVILNAFFAWNEFLFATVFINSSDLKTIPSGLMVFRDALRTDWGVLLSGMVIASIPMIILLIFLQKYLVRGLAEGSVKG